MMFLYCSDCTGCWYSNRFACRHLDSLLCTLAIRDLTDIVARVKLS